MPAMHTLGECAITGMLYLEKLTETVVCIQWKKITGVDLSNIS